MTVPVNVWLRGTNHATRSGSDVRTQTQWNRIGLDRMPPK